MASFEDITVNQIKSYFDVDVADTSKDARITAMLPIAASRIREYCRNTFKSETVVNERPIVKGDKSMAFVKYRPITSITSVIENGITLVEDTDFICYKDEGRFVKIKGTDIFDYEYDGFDSDPGKLLISYIGGETLTQDVIQVFYETVGIFTGLRTRSYITNAGIESVVSLNNIPPEFEAILDLHRKARTL